MAKKKYVRAGKSTPHWGTREIKIIQDRGANTRLKDLKKLLPGRTEDAIRRMRTKLKITLSPELRHEIATDREEITRDRREQAKYVENDDGYAPSIAPPGCWTGPELKHLLNLVPVEHPDNWYKYLPGKTFKDIDEHFKLHEITVSAAVREALDLILASPRANFKTATPWTPSNG